MGAPVECAGEGGGLRAGGGWPSPHGVRAAVGRANEGGAAGGGAGRGGLSEWGRRTG